MAGRKKAGDAPAFLWRKPVLRGKWTQLLQQNKQREHAVPEDVIRNLPGKLELPGYDEAHEVAYGIMPP
ncbi:MAG: hypothetical protein ACFN9G_04235 [Cardiobacterium sp.]|jgi:hypothetical protein